MRTNCTVHQNARNNIEQYGAFIEVHVSTPLEECENRDRKALNANARKGKIPEFTGISDPYDVPEKSRNKGRYKGCGPDAGGSRCIPLSHSRRLH